MCCCQLQSAVSGLNRGLAASEDDLRKADAAALELESAGGSIDLSADLDKLQGKWKLIYSSAFSSRTLGGSRPGPPTGRLLPITLGLVRHSASDHLVPFTASFANLQSNHSTCSIGGVRDTNWSYSITFS